jgi:acylglycerol lipase
MAASKLYRLRSKFDGLRIIMRTWVCHEPSEAVVILVHGIGEHSKVYKPWAKRFNTHGFTVVSFDQRGHGLSGGKRGHTPIYRAYISDLALIYRTAKKLFPNKPIFIYGHSMGGNIVLNFLLKKRRNVIGGIASSPWLTLAFEPPFYKVLLGRIMGLFWPDYSDSNKTSLESEVILDKEEDPLLHDTISITTYLECKKAGKRVINRSDNLTLPLLLMHGTEDKRTSWVSTAKLGSKLSNPMSKFVSFEQAEHELHEDLQQDEVFNTVMAWMQEVLNKQ